MARGGVACRRVDDRLAFLRLGGEALRDDLSRDEIGELRLLARDGERRFVMRMEPAELDRIGRLRVDDHRGRRWRRRDLAIVRLGRIGALALPPLEGGLQARHQHRWIGIAHHDHRGTIRPVPPIVIRLQLRRARRGKRGIRPAEIALGSGQPGQKGRLAGILDLAGERTDALLPFSDHNFALGFQQGRIERRLAHHIGQHVDRLLVRGRIRFGHIQHERRCGQRGRCIGVAAEIGAEPLPDLHRVAVRIVSGAAEHHMLDQVRPALLIGLFHQRTHRDPHPDRDRACRHGVLADGIVEAVGKRSRHPCRIGRNIAALVLPGCDRRRRRGGGDGCGGGVLGLRRRTGAKPDRGGRDRAALQPCRLHRLRPASFDPCLAVRRTPRQCQGAR